ncbi:SEC-C domain-containing protein [bacterium]|nr:SEC-C domain-containing protein [bacterium]
MSLWHRLFGGAATPPDAARDLSRNAPCWCGSGRKYKQCHFERDREHFTAKQNEACKGPT